MQLRSSILLIFYWTMFCESVSNHITKLLIRPLFPEGGKRNRMLTFNVRYGNVFASQMTFTCFTNASHASQMTFQVATLYEDSLNKQDFSCCPSKISHIDWDPVNTEEVYINVCDSRLIQSNDSVPKVFLKEHKQSHYNSLDGPHSAFKAWNVAKKCFTILMLRSTFIVSLL